jgi:hypothetical protein
VICPLDKSGGGSWLDGFQPADPDAEVEPMMKLQDVLLKSMAKRISWLSAAEIIGVTPARWLYGGSQLFLRPEVALPHVGGGRQTVVDIY